MKILITTDLFLPAVNGVVTSVLSLVHGLEERGHEVKILTLSETVHSYTKGTVIRIGSFGAGRLYPGIRIRGFCPRKILRELICWHPDIVHSQCEFNTFRIARLVARRCKIPLIHTYHTVYEDYTHYFSPSMRVGRAMAQRFTRRITKRVDAVIVPTEKVRRLLESYRVKAPVSVIPTGLEQKKDRCGNAADAPALRRRLGIPDDKRILLFLGRLAEEKISPRCFICSVIPGCTMRCWYWWGTAPTARNWNGSQRRKSFRTVCSSPAWYLMHNQKVTIALAMYLSMRPAVKRRG